MITDINSEDRLVQETFVTHPPIFAAGLMNKPLPVPWWNGRPLRLTTYME